MLAWSAQLECKHSLPAQLADHQRSVLAPVWSAMHALYHRLVAGDRTDRVWGNMEHGQLGITLQSME